MASCAFLRAQIALPSGMRYLTASTIEPDAGCSGMGGSASVGIAGVGPRSSCGKAPSSLPTRGDGGDGDADGGGGSGSGSATGLVGISDDGSGCCRGIDGTGPDLPGGGVGRAGGSGDGRVRCGSRGDSSGRERGAGREVVLASSSTLGVREVGPSSTMVSGADPCTSVAASSSKTGARRASLARCGSPSGRVVRRSLSPCDAGCIAPGISCAGSPSSVPVAVCGACGGACGGDGVSRVSSASCTGFKVASCGVALAGPLGGTCAGGLSGGNVPGAAVGANASCGFSVGSLSAADGARGAGRGATGREGAAGLGGGAGALAARSAGRRLPQCTHSRASSGFSCAQKGQNRIAGL